MFLLFSWECVSLIYTRNTESWCHHTKKSFCIINVRSITRNEFWTNTLMHLGVLHTLFKMEVSSLDTTNLTVLLYQKYIQINFDGISLQNKIPCYPESWYIFQCQWTVSIGGDHHQFPPPVPIPVLLRVPLPNFLDKGRYRRIGTGENPPININHVPSVLRRV